AWSTEHAAPSTDSLFLRDWLVQRRDRLDDAGPFLGRAARVLDGGRHRGRLVGLERLAGDDAADLLGVEHFADEELLGNAVERSRSLPAPVVMPPLVISSARRPPSRIAI